jgi:putative ABC transport system substrate-binding protein
MRLRRRDFIAGLGSAAAWPLAARAQQQSLPTIGWLDPASPEALRVYIPEFQKGLAVTGYVEGLNVAIDHRWTQGRYDLAPTLAADMVRRKVALIVVESTTLAQVAKAATQAIPIVFILGGDPVELGLVASFNRTGGNLTGVALQSAEIAAKRLALLRELVPANTSIAMLVNPANPYFTRFETKDLASAARVLGVRLLILNAATASDIVAAFATLAEQQAGALLLGADPFFFAARDQIISLAAHHAVPVMFYESAAVSAGGLLSYGHDRGDVYRQAGIYAGRILKGESPADLPVAQPTKFQLVINLNTAKGLGLTVPPNLLALADEVIE